MTDERNGAPEGLTEPEKAAIREELRIFMRMYPARVPLFVRFFDTLESAAYSPRLQFAAATLGALLITGSGTAFAAQNALPGDPLYGIKVNVEEPFMGAFATSPQAKASWSAQLAARRLSEAEQLAVQNKLTPAAASTIAGGLNEATKNFDTSVAALATSSSNAATVASLASNMEATIAANAQVLNEIASAVPDAAPALQPLLTSMQERTVSLDSARTAMDAATANMDSEQVKLAAQAALGETKGQVSEVASNVVRVAAPTSSAAGLQVAKAQRELDSGQQNFDQGNYEAALESLQAASVEANAAQLNLSVGQELGAAAGIELPSATTAAAFSAELDQEISTNSSSTASSTQPARHDGANPERPLHPAQELQIHL